MPPRKELAEMGEKPAIAELYLPPAEAVIKRPVRTGLVGGITFGGGVLKMETPDGSVKLVEMILWWRTFR